MPDLATLESHTEAYYLDVNEVVSILLYAADSLSVEAHQLGLELARAADAENAALVLDLIDTFCTLSL